MPDQETRIKQGAAELRRVLRMTLVNVEDGALEYAVSHVFEAADRDEPPTWPTDASIQAAYRPVVSRTDSRDNDRSRMREAMLADPIIQAAIALRDLENDQHANALIAAVDEAGL